MKSLQQIINNINYHSLFKEVKIGLEKESQRVTLDGTLATTDHPSVFGCRNFHPSIQTDFSETQVEIITPVANSGKEVLEELAAIHEVVLRSMPADEMLWPMSMPPKLPEEDHDIKIAKLANPKDVAYREQLAATYGKRKQMVSGIHYNFEFSVEFLEKLFEEQTEYTLLKEFKTAVYLKVARNYLRYRWLVTYLIGAAPLPEEGYFTGCKKGMPEVPVRSIRNSRYGYTNDDSVFVSYRSIEDYVTSIEGLVNSGKISEEKEFYSAVRLRGGKTAADLAAKGVKYIEVRNIDNNPYAPYGITEEQIDVLHLFLMYMLWMDEPNEDADDMLKIGEKLNDAVALEHPLTQTSLSEEGEALLAGMADMVNQIGAPAKLVDLVACCQRLVSEPEKTLAGRMITEVNQGISQHDLAVSLGREYYEQAHARPYQLAGYTDMELSTQLLMFDAIQKGVAVEVLDRQDQFLKLTYRGQIEYVKKANMTSRDNYVVPLMMENKTVTKKVLAKAGFNVPQGKEFDSKEEALSAYGYFMGKGIVVKPKSTNYGLGISIFKEGASQAAYEEAVRIAFSEDRSILVEEFISGTEYRFFVIDGKVKAIMLRVPANVCGDGVHSIAELVAIKNQDPLRGTNHRAPLQLIELGDIEKLMLQEQGVTPETILAEDQVVYLRENSNVSTGGDSIDMTDEMSECYKEIAAQAVEAMGAKISGIDLIIPDYQKVTTSASQDYGIIEANFNPAMHMHVYPFAGKGRRLTQDVLRLLYPAISFDA